jgi:ATP-dependent RNA helicase DeaD
MRPARDQGREMVWFRVDIGRERKADPRWLLPLLCRAGNVTKAEIGSIKIFDRDTRFEIAADFADKFADAARTMKPNEGRISRIGGSMGIDAGSHGKPTPADRQRKDETNAATSLGPERGPRTKTPWQDRNKEKAGAHPHRKRDASKDHPKGAGPRSGSSKPNGTYKPGSKFAHKKKDRPAS